MKANVLEKVKWVSKMLTKADEEHPYLLESILDLNIMVKVTEAHAQKNPLICGDLKSLGAPATVRRRLDRLEDMGCIERFQDPKQDLRFTFLRPTTLGLSVLQAVMNHQ